MLLNNAPEVGSKPLHSVPVLFDDYISFKKKKKIPVKEYKV